MDPKDPMDGKDPMDPMDHWSIASLDPLEPTLFPAYERRLLFSPPRSAPVDRLLAGTTRPPGLLVKWLCFLFYLILFPSTL